MRALRMNTFIALLLCPLLAMAIEEPSYRVIRQSGNFELRSYAPCLVAETLVAAPFENAGNEAFSMLAGFIFGKNRARQTIEMTTPAHQQESGETIGMTSPVAQTPVTGGDEAYVFSFVMPARYTRDTLPEPLDARVKIRALPARMMAVVTYSGTWSRSRYEKHEAELLAAVRGAGMTAVGKPVFARYNAPYTPWFMRRNEVMIEIRPPS